MTDGRDDDQRERQQTAADGAALAREALERARSSARDRGASRRSAKQSSRDRAQRRRDAGVDVDRMPFGSGRDPQTVGGALQGFFARMGWQENIDIASVTARWREVVGDQIADKCEPVDFADGVLTVRAASTAWSTQLTMMAPAMRTKLNEHVGRNIVTDLKVLGPTQRSWTKGARTVKGRGPRDTYG